MLKRLFKLTLTPKRYLPVVQSRFFTTVDSKNDVPRHSDDIVDDIEQFHTKLSISGEFYTYSRVLNERFHLQTTILLQHLSSQF